MQYLYHPNAKEDALALIENDYKYIIKARRHTIGDRIALRNLDDNNLYHYEIEAINKKEANLKLQSYESKSLEAKRSLHIGWCVVDPKTIEKHIASLNEMGVDKITFIYCNRSQKNYRVDFKRLEKILINSSSQCGRSSIIELNTLNSLEEFKEAYPKSVMLNFSNHLFSKESEMDTIVIGCEGGFTQEEVKLFDSEQIVGLDTPLILKSESAAVAISSKLLL
jgi:16S rRNA (uracil1498-N3)-methyltransferase